MVLLKKGTAVSSFHKKGFGKLEVHGLNIFYKKTSALKDSFRGLKEIFLFVAGFDEQFWLRHFQIGATLDALMTFVKSGGFRGHLKGV